MRGLRIGFGLCSGLVLGLLGLSLGQCSFYLPERAVCTDLGCNPATSDLQPTPPDLTRDPNDPSANGSYSAAYLSLLAPVGMSDSLFRGPSDDGVNLSTREATYPVILMGPPKGVPLEAMRPYADRLISHGFFVAMYLVNDQSNDVNYRDVTLKYLDSIFNNTDVSVRSHLDTSKVGLIGYELSAKISVLITAAQPAQVPPISGLFLIDPADLFASQPQSGVQAIGQLHLPSGAPIAMLGEPRSTQGSSPCIQPPQKGYNEFWNAVQSPALAIVFNGANLGDFIASYPDPVCTQGSTTPQAQTQALALKYATAYFQWTLKGSNRARDYLLGPDFNVDAQSTMLTGKTK